MYWQSDISRSGNYGPRWIRVHLKPGCRIHDLHVIVQRDDMSCCPTSVQIRFGLNECTSCVFFNLSFLIPPDHVLRTATTEADIDGDVQCMDRVSFPGDMDLRPLLKSSGFSAIDILPKTFDQSHRVVDINFVDNSGGYMDYRVRGFIARTFVDTKAVANSCGIIVGARQDNTKGELLLFRPFFGAQNEVREVRQQRVSPSNLNVTRALGFSRCFGVYGLIGARLNPAISITRCNM
jgi:hypothetical protein